MASGARSAVAPLYLFACVVLGGSAQGAWQNMVLQLAGLAIIAWAAAVPSREPLPGLARLLFLLAIAAIGVVALQLLPLPPAVWASGNRTHLVDGYRLLGRTVPPLPTSLTPYETLSTLFCIIPPLAMFCAIVRQDTFRPIWLAAAMLGGVVAGIVLSVLKVAGAGPSSPWYLYGGSDAERGAGFFANSNQMASLLVMSLPFVAAIGAAAKRKDVQRRLAPLLVLTLLAPILIVGFALGGSVTGYALVLPVTLASAMIVLPQANRLYRWVGVFAALSLIAALALLTSNAIGVGNRTGQHGLIPVQSRAVVLETTGKAIIDHMPLGTGLGSFASVYRTYESPDAVTSAQVAHARNDYAELILELGAPGIVLLLLFLSWWIAAARAIRRKGKGEPFARAGSIASAAVLVISLSDFPLRTAAISSCFAMCLALMVRRQIPPGRELGDLRPARHLVFS